jgi:hypothetical protein
MTMNALKPRFIARHFRFVISAAAITVSGIACDSTARPLPGAPSRVVLTDGPFPYNWIDRVDLFVVSVSVSVAPDTSAAAEFHTIATPNRAINVMALSNGLTEELGAAPLPPGVITAVRMVIDTDLSSMTTVHGFVITDDTFSPSITVPDTGALIVIDFDIGKAFILNRELNPGSPDSGFVFSPVLRAADARRTGSIRGTVRAQSGSGAPVEHVSMRLYWGDPNQPENTWSVMGTAGTNASGVFVFSFVTRSAHWATIPAQAGGTYIVAADPHPGSTLGRALVQNISVMAGAETDVGNVILP